MTAVPVTPGQDVLLNEIFVAAPPERVFQALTDPSQLPKWWGSRELYRITRMEADVREGGAYIISGQGVDGVAFDVRGEYIEVDPPHLLAYSWTASWTGDLKSTVRWELTPARDGTLVKVRHSGLSSSPEAAKSYGGGWPIVMGWMQAYLEGGVTIDTRK
jgi:uncharacterized protein YndB with AHSA1/START domain